MLSLVTLHALLVVGSLCRVRLLVLRSCAAAQVTLVVEDWLLRFGSGTILGVILFVEVRCREGLDTLLEDGGRAATSGRLLRQLILMVLAILLRGEVSSHLEMTGLTVVRHRV